MIIDKLIPCFWLIELEGKVINEIVGNSYGISKIIVGSEEFNSDITAINEMTEAMSSLVSSQKGKSQDGGMEYNPSFFPTLNQIKLTSDQIDSLIENEMVAEEISSTLEPDKIAIAITTLFDDSGDHVIAKWANVGTDYSIKGKVYADIDVFMQDKILTVIEHADMLSKPRELNKLGVH